MAGLRIILPVLAALALAGAAVAAEALTAELMPLSARPRGDAPMLFDAKLTWRGSGLLEGTLEITLRENGEPICVQRTQELALTAGVRALRFLTPPLAARYGSEIEAQLRFLGRGAPVELGTTSLALRSGTRSFVLALCTPRGTGNDRLHALWQSLRCESFQPASAAASRQLTTSPVYLAPEDFPSDPLTLLAFNIVVLDGDAFGLLREKQLAALARWVGAGGNLCVVPGGGVKEEHVAFLNALAGASAPFALDTQSRFVGREIFRAHAGFGRLVVATLPLESAADFATPEWRRAAAFLWKFRVPQIEAAARSGSWQGDADPFRYNPEAQTENRARNLAFSRPSHALLPGSARLIPWWVLAAILGAFVLVIGPGDWLVLGWLRRRRWTWLLFPLCAVACTAVTVATAELYLGGHDSRTSLIVTDLGSDRRVVRETRFQQFFAARNREVTTDFHQGIAVPCAAFSLNQYYNFSGRGSGATEPLVYAGQFPARYSLRQQLRQWSPQVQRLTSLADAADASGIAWETLDPQARNRSEWNTALAKSAGLLPNITLYSFHQGRAEIAGPDALKLAPFIRVLCTPGSAGLDAIVTGAAPHAGAGLDDLQICDPDDPLQWVVVALRQEGSNLHLYRRIYRRD